MNLALLCDFLCGVHFWRVFGICLAVYILLYIRQFSWRSAFLNVVRVPTHEL